MIKSYIAAMIVVLTVGFINAKDRETEYKRLIEAIEKSEVARVKTLVKRISPLSETEKKLLLEEAEDAIDLRENSLSLLDSPKDFASCIVGGMVSFIGAKMFLGSDSPLSNGYGIAAVLGGIILMVEGVKGKSALSRLANADTIEKILTETDK